MIRNQSLISMIPRVSRKCIYDLYGTAATNDGVSAAIVKAGATTMVPAKAMIHFAHSVPFIMLY